ncbi:MAG: hypothetical protein IJD28_06630 [Deferribacterales bacterium]|nr:hypothetical protein [Deferribacterales bacterium]
MDKSEGKDWFAKTLNKVTEETAKVYKISRLKLEIVTTNKSCNEKLNLMSRKLVNLIKDGKIDSQLFEPDYSAVLSYEAKIEELQEEIEELKTSLKINMGKTKHAEDAPEDNKSNTQSGF